MGPINFPHAKGYIPLDVKSGVERGKDLLPFIAKTIKNVTQGFSDPAAGREETNLFRG
jgi:hypothetical protein